MAESAVKNDSRLFSKSLRTFIRQKQPRLKSPETAGLIHGWLLLNQAQIHITASDQALAREKLDQLKALPDLPAVLEAEYLLAGCSLCNQFNCLDELNEHLTRLEKMALKDEVLPVRAQCLYYRASMEASGGDYQKASGHYLEALRTQEIRDDRDFTAEIYNDLGFCSNRLGNSGQAEEYYKISLRLRKDTGNLAGQAESLNNLGILHMKANHFQKSEDALKEAYNLETLAGDRIGEGYTLLNLGVLAYNRSQFSNAYKHYHRALSLRKSIGDVLGQGFCYTHLAHLSLMLETPEAAYKHAERGRNYFALAGEAYGVIKMDVLLCNILLEQNKTEQAGEYLDKVAPGNEGQPASRHHELFLIPRLKLALACGRPEQAEGMWHRYLEYDHGYSKSMEGMQVHGGLLSGLGRKDQAREAWRQALDRASEKVLIYEKAKILLCLGGLEPETKAGKDALNEALGLFKNIGAPYWERKTKKIINREAS